MNKADKIFIGLIVVISCLLYVPSLWYAYQNQGSVKEVVVSYKDKVVLQKRLSLDHVYEVKGTLGPVKVEVKDEKVRVEKETSPYHLCSIQGLSLIHILPNQLSGGQQQRVSICRAIMASPAVVLADEPTGNLDRKNSEEIVGLLKQLHREQKQTLIMITHDESIALQADRILQIEDGKICLLYTSI